MTETSDSGNYSQYEDRERSNETCKQSSAKLYSKTDISSDDLSEESDYDGSENVDQTSVYTWVMYLSL